MASWQITVNSIILGFLLVSAAFFSCAETALMSVNRYRLRHLARMKKPYAMRLVNLLKRPDRLLGAVLIGNTFANMIAASLATIIANHFWGELGGILTAVVLTVIVLIFAEIAPKTLAALYPDQVSRLVAYPIDFILRILYPAVWAANAISNNLLKMFGMRVLPATHEALSREELRSIVRDTAGKISRDYQNMLLGILDLNKMTVDDVMIPRNQIKGIDLAQSWKEIAAGLNRNHHDWIPVYKKNVNQIVGVIYAHDMLKVLLEKSLLTKELFQQFLQQPYFVPQGTPLYIQLNYFQQHHDKVAFVVDEYGEIQGLLTLNDILEEIIGDFNTSLGKTKSLEKQADGSYLVNGSLTVREFNRLSEFELPVGGPKTINGLIVEHLQSLPRIGTTVLIAGHPIEIMRVKANHIKLARVFKTPVSV